MFEYGLRFVAGGLAVSAFAALGDTLRPKSFAGLFGAAPSIAVATLLIALSQKGDMRAKMADAQEFLETLEGGNEHMGTPFEGLRFWNCDGRSQCTNQ